MTQPTYDRHSDTITHAANPQILTFGLSFVILVLIALIALPPMVNTRADLLRTQSSHIQDFANILNRTENNLQQMQAAVRGYLATQSPAFLEQYTIVQERLPANFADLMRLDEQIHSSLAKDIADLQLLSTRWMDEGAHYQLSLVNEGRRSEAITDLASGKSQLLFDSLREQIDRLRTHIQTLQNDVATALGTARSFQSVFLVSASLLGLIALGFVMVGFRRVITLTQERQWFIEQIQAQLIANERMYQTAQIDHQRLQTVIANSPEGLVVVEQPERRIVLVNQSAHSLLGELTIGNRLDPHPLQGRVFLPGGQPCPNDRLPLMQTLNEGVDVRHMEVIVEHPHGQRIPMLVTSVPLHDKDGKVQGALAVFQDLRQLREVERLKSDFVALVSHELRTPLTTIKGCTEQLLRGTGETDPVRIREYLQIIAQQGEHLHELIDNLLSLSQIEAGALRLRRDMIALPPLIQGVLRQIRDQIGDLRVQAHLPATLPNVSADARRIEQVLTNVIENARKFSPPDGVILVTATATQNEVVVGVQDQGPGILPAERERVFERFYQIARPDTRNFGGSGLGLAICKALVEAHGGRIWIEDAPGGGTLLQWSLPALPIDEPMPAITPNTLTRQEVGPTNILVIDDDPALRRLLDQSLRDRGYRVQLAAEPQSAVELLTQQPPDLVLLDVMLPGSDGFALCKQVREWTAVPIIMLTARASESDIVRGLQLGADDYMTKPFRMSELFARIEAVLRRVQSANPSNEPALIQTGEITIDLVQRRVTRADTPIELTPTEYSILIYLARHLGQVLTREQILHEVWGEIYRDESQYLWVHIAHLRQKLEADSKRPRYIQTERGVGYRLAKLS